MTNQSKALKGLTILCLTVCFMLTAGLFFASYETKHPKWIPHIPSENQIYLNIQNQYTKKIEHTIFKLLEPLVGPNKVRIAVQLDINLKNAKRNTKTLSPQSSETLSSQQTLEKEIHNLINQMHISVVIDGNTRKGDKGIYQARPPKEMEAYKRLIKSAVGFNPQRGDTLEVQNMPFEFKPKAHPPHNHSKHLGTAIVLIGLICILWVLSKSSATPPQTTLTQQTLNEINQNPAKVIAVLKNWFYMPPQPKNHNWTPIQKIGIILLALEEESVRQILVALDDNEVRTVAKTMTTLGVIPPKESAQVLTELHHAMFNGSAVVGNPTRVQQILSESTRNETIKLKESIQPTHSHLWQELEKMNNDFVAEKLQNLAPEKVAYILYHINSQKASQLVQTMPAKKTSQILIHLSHIGSITQETNKKMEQEAVQWLQNTLNTSHHISGQEKTTQILANLTNSTVSNAVMQDLTRQEPDLGKNLALNLLKYQDIGHWSDENIQILLRHTPKAQALAAFVNAPILTKQAIQRNIPESLWQELKKEIQKMEKQITPEESFTAQNAMLETAKKLIRQEKIKL